MKYKLYRAIDKIDGNDSAFMVREDGMVDVSNWMFSRKEEIQSAIDTAKISHFLDSSRFDDALKPVIIAEFEV